MSEQSLMGLSVGMAMNGCKIILEIMFCDFITLIADQLINHATKFNDLYSSDLNIVIRTPSGGYRGYGATHSQSLESIFLGIPGMRIIAPNIFDEPGIVLKKSLDLGIPVLFIENKLDYSRDLFTLNDSLMDLTIIENNGFNVTKVGYKNEKPMMTIITYGGMVTSALKIQKELFFEEEITAEVIAVTSISNIDYKNIASFIDSKNVFSIEESCADFGWGSNLLFEIMKHKSLLHFDNFGAKKTIIPASSTLENVVLPSEKAIISKIKMIWE